MIGLTARLIRQRIGRKHAHMPLAKGICHALTFPQTNMLLTVQECGRATIKELAEVVGVSAPSASSMVDRLVDMGALTREQNQADRREVIVRLAPGVEDQMGEVERQILQAFVEILKEVGPECAREWSKLYAHVGEVLRNGGGTAENNGDPGSEVVKQ
ncbi:MAG: MarR family transcriptional regulator [Nitrospiraceae bacterium]|nr:MarR family transcriptional regulator [Nitrospiraceae bacterium]